MPDGGGDSGKLLSWEHISACPTVGAQPYPAPFDLSPPRPILVASEGVVGDADGGGRCGGVGDARGSEHTAKICVRWPKRDSDSPDGGRSNACR